jgi:hypothetical protein
MVFGAWQNSDGLLSAATMYLVLSMPRRLLASSMLLLMVSGDWQNSCGCLSAAFLMYSALSTPSNFAACSIFVLKSHRGLSLFIGPLEVRLFSNFGVTFFICAAVRPTACRDWMILFFIWYLFMVFYMAIDVAGQVFTENAAHGQKFQKGLPVSVGIGCFLRC